MKFFKQIKKQLKIINAYKKYLDDKLNIKCVIINGKYQVIEINCGTCFHYESGYTKYCTYPSSIGCDKHSEFKNNKNK